MDEKVFYSIASNFKGESCSSREEQANKPA